MIKFAVTQDWNPSGPKQLVLKLWATLFHVKTITFPLFPMKDHTRLFLFLNLSVILLYLRMKLVSRFTQTAYAASSQL